MFYKYEIRNNNGEECLYLYLSLNYEFSKEFTDNNNLKDISDKFIKINNINFKGKKIYYVVNGVVVKKLDNSKNIYTTSDEYSPDNYCINLKLDDGSMCEISLREYLVSALFYYYDDNIGNEVFKAICILFNTYCFKCMNEVGYITSNNNFMSFVNIEEYEIKYNDFDKKSKRINEIINSVSCIYLSYNNELILPFIHLCNIGKTLSSKKYSFLSSVKSLWDLSSPNYINIFDFSYNQINKILNININNKSVITSNNNMILFDNYKYSVSEIKSLLSLNSNYIYIIQNKNYIRFITKGIGESLGLSIYGSIFIEENGGDYIKILNYYFPKVTIYKYIKELS